MKGRCSRCPNLGLASLLLTSVDVRCLFQSPSLSSTVHDLLHGRMQSRGAGEDLSTEQRENDDFADRPCSILKAVTWSSFPWPDLGLA